MRSHDGGQFHATHRMRLPRREGASRRRLLWRTHAARHEALPHYRRSDIVGAVLYLGGTWYRRRVTSWIVPMRPSVSSTQQQAGAAAERHPLAADHVGPI